jgi:hypothetical protein
MKMWLLLTASMGVILLLASAATAQDYTRGKENTATPTATKGSNQPCSRPLRKSNDPSLATSYASVAMISVRQPCFQHVRLRQTGGLPLVAPLALGALVVLVGSGLVMRSILRG